MNSVRVLCPASRASLSKPSAVSSSTLKVLTSAVSLPSGSELPLRASAVEAACSTRGPQHISVILASVIATWPTQARVRLSRNLDADGKKRERPMPQGPRDSLIGVQSINHHAETPVYENLLSLE